VRAIGSRTAPRPPELSLLTSALRGNVPERWEEGLAFPAAAMGRLRIYDPCGGTPLDLLDRPADAPDDVDPFVVQAWHTCSTGTARPNDDDRAQALEQVEALTPFAVERELWTRDLARARSMPNRGLVATAADVAAGQVRATTLTPTGSETTGVSPIAAVGLLEEALGQHLGRGYLHVGLRGATFLPSTADGNVLRTKLRSIVVPGSGYPGTGPDGTAAPAGSTWVYGTGPVTVWLSPPVVPADGADVIDRNLNTRTIRAERLAMVAWQGPLFAVLMTLKSD
jgi:hypothetical protein